MLNGFRRSRADYAGIAENILDQLRNSSVPNNVRSMMISEAQAYIDLAKLAPESLNNLAPVTAVVAGAPIVTEAPPAPAPAEEPTP